jgi:hypothetical protein
MRSFLRVAVAWTLVAALAGPALAQESKIGAEVRREGERLAEKCGSFSAKSLIGCATTLITDHPFHLALGSLAPKNGFGLGLAFVAPQSKPNDDWRISWSADAVGTSSGSWRAGAYAKFVNTNVGGIEVTGAGGGTSTADALPRPYPTITVYGQATSLPTLATFGLGNDSSSADRVEFGMRQSSIGTRVFWPIGRGGLFNRLNPIALGELNGRWVRLADVADRAPSTLQLGEGLRVAPAIGRLQLIYTGDLQQFIAPSSSSASFRRWTLDLHHDVSLWTTTRQATEHENNTPNECATSASRTKGEYGCADPLAITTNRVGMLGFRVLLSKSQIGGGSAVPFYFQRTIGGSDIDGERLLASYDDYRFRGPNLLVFQLTYEQSIWGPIGAFAAAEQGRVALIGEPLTTGLKHTYGAGITLRAGGVPLVTMWLATGGTEGRHLAVTMNTSLLGGSSRPSLH